MKFYSTFLQISQANPKHLSHQQYSTIKNRNFNQFLELIYIVKVPPNPYVKVSQGIHHYANTTYTHHNGKQVMDFIGRFENFKEDLQKICKIIDVPYIEKHENKRGDNDYLKFYTSKSIELVNQAAAKDFEYFGYKMLDPKDFPDKL